jgi:uncharacterized membrane protein YcaP (DUF421 family)
MDIFKDILGLETDQLNTLQMMARAFVIFFVLLVLIRIAGIRTLGKHNAFDQLTILILGAVMGRAIVAGEQPFFGSMLATGVIIGLHRLVAWLTLVFPKLENIFKGKKILLAKGNQLQVDHLKQANVTPEDIQEAMRQEVNANDLKEMNEVYLERSGYISFVKKEKST